MRAIARVGGPLVRMLTNSTNIVLRLFGLGTVVEPGVTEQDIRAMVEQATESGAVQKVEHEIVENTFRLGDRAVESIMTPRPDIHWVDLSDDADAIREQVTEALRDRFLVCEEVLDSLVGVVRAKDLVAAAVKGQDVASVSVLRDVARTPLFVPATMPVYQLLSTLRSAQQHAAVVLDEYGGVAGLVDMDDVLEGLVGDVPLAEDGEAAAWLRRPDGSWEVDGSVALDEVESRLDLEVEERERAELLTLGGFVMARLGRVPVSGDEFRWSGRRVRVLLMAGRRVERVLIEALHA